MADTSLNNIITINRGDDYSVILYLNEGTELQPIAYTLKPEDEIYVGVMEPNQPFESAIIKQKYTSKNLNKDGNVKIIFSSNDTSCLYPGKYYYQIKLRYKDEDGDFLVNTVVQKTEFIIVE